MNTNYPTARGSIHIRSIDPKEPPVITNVYACTDADVQVLMMGWKHLRRLARSVKGFRGEQVGTMPKFPAGSKAAPLPYSADQDLADVPELQYSKEDDTAIVDYIQRSTGSAWHPACTLPQLPKDKGGCVDSRLNFYGVKQLKVADLSITPRVPGGNTYSVALLVGERAADFLVEDLSL